jgi:hypothetical protein
MFGGYFGAGSWAAPVLGAPDQHPGLPLTSVFCLLRLSLPHEEPDPQGPAPDLEIWQADSAGE